METLSVELGGEVWTLVVKGSARCDAGGSVPVGHRSSEERDGCDSEHR
jgi:hypothetical protein